MSALRQSRGWLFATALTFSFCVGAYLPSGGSVAHAAKKKRKKKASRKGRKKAARMKAPKKGLSLGAVAEQQKSPQRARIDAAVRDFKEERYAPAAVTLHDILEGSDTPGGLRVEARYHLAKSLYRLNLHHSALHHFNEVLKGGPDSSFYAPSLEWCLFIARKIVADARVLDVVARYSTGTFPEEYESEFNYLLARHHYVRALAAGEASDSAEETTVQQSATGGRSLSGDVFGDDDDDDFEDDEPSKPAIKRGGGSISLDADIFGDDDEDDEPPPKKKAPKKKMATKAARGDAEMTPKEHIDAANRSVVRVKTASKFAARAKFLEAVLLYDAGQDNEALNAFKSVVRMTKAGAPQQDPELRQLAFFQLARTHFGAKQPSFSIYYYDKMTAFTEEWLEAMYESSWAEFRLGNYEKALGNLLTLHSPFFKDEYFPESHVLKAVVYYENCRYDDAKRILTAFLARYDPILEELGKLTERSKKPQAYYEVLANLRDEDTAKLAGDRARIMSQVLSIALSDPEIGRLDDAYQEIDAELKSIGSQGQVFAQSRLQDHLLEVITKARGEVQADAGRAVKRKLEFERDQIKQLVQQALRIEIETAAAEKRRFELSLRDIAETTKDRTNAFIEWTDDERLVWPFEEEYWADELGTYELTLGNTCRVR